MLSLKICNKELWDETREEFVVIKGKRLTLEHSLVSISKWESKWHIPFLVDEPKKTTEQFLDYIKCMTINYCQDDDVLYNNLNQEEIDIIAKYMEDSYTATWFSDKAAKGSRNREIITSEIIYYSMFTLNIPIECEKWNINRLLTLIRVFNEKNKSKDNKTHFDRKQMLSERQRLNAERRAKANSKG